MFLAWAGDVAGDKADADANMRKAMAMLSGRQDMLVQRCLRAWRQTVSGDVGRRNELLRAVVLKMRNRLMHQCFQVRAPRPHPRAPPDAWPSPPPPSATQRLVATPPPSAPSATVPDPIRTGRARASRRGCS